MTENYFDGKWRLIVDLSAEAVDKLLSRGFEVRISKGKYMARWPSALPYTSFVFISCQEETAKH